MDDRNAQVGWTEAQWNRVREEVLRAWQSVRVAGSFLPVYGSLPPSTQVIPSEMFNPDGTVDEGSTARLFEIALPVTLTRQQVLEEDLSDALQQFRRRATQVAQLEDWYIFNGTYPHDIGDFPADIGPTTAIGAKVAQRSYRPDYSFLNFLADEDVPFHRSALVSIASPETQVKGLRQRNPGALGILGGPSEPHKIQMEGVRVVDARTERWPTNENLMDAIVSAMNTLQRDGYVAPYVCVFGRRPFQAAHRPVGESVTFPRDRLEPLIGRELLHASAIDVTPANFSGYVPPAAIGWESRGVLLSLAGDAIDLAVAVEAAPEFRQVDAEGHYVFSVFERFALRIKDTKAIMPFAFVEPSTSNKHSRPASARSLPPTPNPIVRRRVPRMFRFRTVRQV